MTRDTLLLLLLTMSMQLAFSFVSVSRNNCFPSVLSAHQLGVEDTDVVPSGLARRQLLQAALSSSLLFGSSSTLPAMAEEPKTTVYLTGKAPKIPGNKPKDKNDVSGTRKDPSFLRSLSDCKSKCETTAAFDGLARSKEDCLSECQDICCKTYEQCTFGIVPRI
jgi:hypothetical protein